MQKARKSPVGAVKVTQKENSGAQDNDLAPSDNIEAGSAEVFRGEQGNKQQVLGSGIETDIVTKIVKLKKYSRTKWQRLPELTRET